MQTQIFLPSFPNYTNIISNQLKVQITNTFKYSQVTKFINISKTSYNLIIQCIECSFIFPLHKQRSSQLQRRQTVISYINFKILTRNNNILQINSLTCNLSIFHPPFGFWVYKYNEGQIISPSQTVIKLIIGHSMMIKSTIFLFPNRQINQH